MSARSPEQICRLFQQFMAEGDVESLLNLYEPEAVILSRTREAQRGRLGLRQQLAPKAAAKINFTFRIDPVIQSGDIVLMHPYWTASKPEPIAEHAVEVARRQPDGSWRWVIGDPFTVGRLSARANEAA